MDLSVHRKQREISGFRLRFTHPNINVNLSPIVIVLFSLIDLVDC